MKMKIKIKVVVLLLVLGTVLLSGCMGDEKPSPEENATPEETITPGENITSEETVTPLENETEEEITPTENETVGESENVSSEIRETPYTIRLVNKRANPSNLEIKNGEKVAWINLEENPKRRLTLVSEQGLFENQSLVYKRAFAYTFNETGDYSFTVVGQPKMGLNVSVAEP